MGFFKKKVEEVEEKESPNETCYKCGHLFLRTMGEERKIHIMRWSFIYHSVSIRWYCKLCAPKWSYMDEGRYYKTTTVEVSEDGRPVKKKKS